MTQYIDKAAVVADIERRINENKKEIQHAIHKHLEEYFEGYEDALVLFKEKFLDTLEVKEMDLEKELSILDNTLFDLDGVAVAGATHYLTVEDVKDIAKHFFELGLNAKKEETKQPEYSCTQSIYHRGEKHYWNIGDILAYYHYSSDCEGEHILGKIVDVKIDEEQDDWVYTFENGRIYYEEELLENGIYVKVEKK